MKTMPHQIDLGGVRVESPPPVQFLDAAGNMRAEQPPMTDEQAMEGLRALLLGRRFDELCILLQRRGQMVTLAPGIGQEACTVGSAMALRRDRDWFIPQYREAAGQLYHGLPLVQAFLWHMGSPIGFVIPEGVKMMPFNAGVAGHVPHAVGIAWGLKQQKKDGVTIAHFGDGATSQGDFYEAANLAGVVKAPVILFCQNNEWAISTPRSQQSAAPTLAQKAAAFGMPGIQIDGNDLFAVYEVTRRAVERARAGEGPTLIEAMTYRLGIHTTADDASRYEPSHLKEDWKDRDPILRLQRYLERRGTWSAKIGEAMEADVKAQLDAAWAAAQASPIPNIGESFTKVFAEMTPRLREQQGQAEGRDA